MALKFDTFKYGGMTTPDISSGAKMILEGLQTPGKIADKMQADENLELQKARQAKQDALATPGSPEWMAAKEAEKGLKFDIMKAEYDWNMKNNSAFRANIPGTTEFETLRANKNADEIAIIDAQSAAELKKQLAMIKAESAARLKEQLANPANKILLSKYVKEQELQKAQEVLAKKIIDLPTEVVTSTTITPEQVDKVRAGLEGTAITNAGYVYNKEYAKLTAPTGQKEILDENGDPIIINGKPLTISGKPQLTTEEAHQEALKRAGLLDVIEGKSPVIDESKLPKAGTTKTTKKLTAEERTQAQLNIAIKAAQEGKVPAALVLEVVNKLNPKKSFKESLEEDKLALDILELQEKIDKNYFGKSGSGSGKENWLKTLEEVYKTYGTPDVVGEGHRAGIETALSELQSRENASDADMANAIENARGVYAYPGGLGVDEDGFKEKVEANLIKIILAKKIKKLENKKAKELENKKAKELEDK